MDFAGIQYMGEPGSTHECKDAIMRLIQYGDKVTKAKIISASANHGFLLEINEGERVVIKSGFSSGYGGTGPRGFSYILQLLDFHGADIEEYKVPNDLLERLDSSMLTNEDMELLENKQLARRVKWRDYIFDDEWDMKQRGGLWHGFPTLIPFAIVDRRIVDLALLFWENPDEKLMTGYRRLEDIIRLKSGINEHGAKLFSQALIKGPLNWPNLDESEKIGRSNLFTNAYMAHRNPRAHRELEDNSHNQLTEFLLLNHLFILETTLVDIVKES